MNVILYLPIFLHLVILVEMKMEILDRVIEGQKLEIHCPVKSVNPEGVFRWSFAPFNETEYHVLCAKPTKEIKCIKRKLINWQIFADMSTLSLTIDKVSYKNAGTYKCFYIDGTNFEQHHFKVNILTSPGKPQIQSIPSVLTENKIVQLICTSEGGNPKPVLRWSWKDFSNSKISKEQRITSTMSQSNNTYGWVTLYTTWIPKSSDDGNSISCLASNSLATKSSNWMFLNINYPPIIDDFPSYVNYGLIGDEISIECKTTSKSTVSFKWINEKGQIYSNGSYLIINPLRISDKGSYRCVVTNSVGTSSATLDIKVLSKPIIKVPGSVIVNEWETLYLKCDAVPPNSNVTWWLEDKIISFTNELKYEIRGKQSLDIQCRASVFPKLYADRSVVTNEKIVRINVQYIPPKPTISANPEGTVLTGSDVTLTCNPNKTNPGFPKPGYIWMKRDSKWIKNGTNFLTLSFVKFEESGIYSCTLFNKLGSSEESLYMLIVEGQPGFGDTKIRYPKILFIKVGRSFKIECQFEARPPPTIRWFINGILIKNNSKRIHSETTTKSDIWTTSFLNIEEPNTHSEENYRCLGENKYGSLSQDYIVRVIYPPKIISTEFTVAANVTGPVSYREAVSLNCSVLASPNISISWNRKLMNHNEKIIQNDTDKYLILERPLFSIKGLESILYIVNFLNEDYGRYLCIAKNTEGQIETHFDIRKFSIPDPAHNLIVDSRTWTSLTIKWTPGFDGGYHQIFTVSYGTEMQKHPIQMRTRDTNVTLTNLLPDVLYVVNISSSNELGTSVSTRSIKAKTLELMVDRDQIFYVNKDERIVEFELPSNMSDSVFCLTIEQMDIQKDLVGDWIPLQKCIRNNIKKIKIDNPYDRFRVKICLVNFPDVCTNTINQRSESNVTDAVISTKLIGIVAATCTVLAIVLAILLSFMLIRSRNFLPVISDFKGIKRNRKSSYSKDDNSNFNVKSTPLCSKKQSFNKESGGCPLLSTYSCDQVHMPGNPIEILNVCPPHNIFAEGLYSNLVKSSSINSFPYTLTSNNIIHQSTMNNVSSCCCHEDQQVFSMSLPASRITKPDKIIYEVMV